MEKDKQKSNCPVNYALEVFGDKWTFLIIRDLTLRGKRHYNEFLQSEEKIATNILADRLTKLENNDIVIKQPDPSNGSKYIYTLSKKGIDLVPLLIEVIIWAVKHDETSDADQNLVNAINEDKGAAIKNISDQLLSDIKI